MGYSRLLSKGRLRNELKTPPASKMLTTSQPSADFAVNSLARPCGSLLGTETALYSNMKRGYPHEAASSCRTVGV